MIFSVLNGLLANLRAGIRMALFLRVGESSLKATPIGLLLLIGFAVLLRCAADYYIVGPRGEWTFDGLPDVLFPIALGVVSAAVLAEFSGNHQRFLLLLTVFLAIGLPVKWLTEGIGLFVETAELRDHGYWIQEISTIWTVLASGKAAVRLLEVRGKFRQGVVYGSLAILMALPMVAAQSTDSLWSPASGEEGDYDRKYDALTEEKAFYQQPVLLDRSLASLEKQRPERTELFFVGMAGDAEQGVFFREVLAVERMLSERFGISGHAVSLINNYEAAMEYPLASVTGLRRSLRRVSELMDRENDILLLFITSHGTHDHSVALDFWPLHFDALTPQVLRQILDESAIKWRIVVVSACYSGGFVEPLRDDHTIVITASAPDRTSFGCSDQNDWTYFGKAFFDEALRHENDLVEAFLQARRTISRREEAEGIEIESDPMIAAGPAMKDKWRSFIQEHMLRD